MAKEMEYSEYVRLISSVLRKRTAALLEDLEWDLRAIPEEKATFRTAFFLLLWDEARKSPLELNREFFFPFKGHLRARRRPGESESATLARLRENLNKVRRTINQELEAAGVSVYVDLEYGLSDSKSATPARTGVSLVLDEALVAALRERDRLRRARGFKRVSVTLAEGRGPVKIGDFLELQTISPIRGFMTLLVYSRDGCDFLLPDPDARTPIAVEPRKRYKLPGDFSRAVRWPLQGLAGLHTVIAIVTRHNETILPYHGHEVLDRLDRGVGRQPVSIWSLPKNDVALGRLDVAVLPAS